MHARHTDVCTCPGFVGHDYVPAYFVYCEACRCSHPAHGNEANVHARDADVGTCPGVVGHDYVPTCFVYCEAYRCSHLAHGNEANVARHVNVDSSAASLGMTMYQRASDILRHGDILTRPC